MDDNPTRGKWDTSVAVEESTYYWNGEPVRFESAHSSRPNSRVTLVDLFCGAGGFSVGFELAGFESLLGIDIHKPALDTYRLNRPGVAAILGDIRRASSTAIAGLLAGRDVTVLSAGVPCQGFSLANRKRHDEDERNFLFQEFVRIAEALMPTAVVVENVSGMVSSAGGRFVEDISSEISRLGYDVHVQMLNAADFGVPQIRQRLFFVGVPKGARWAWPTPTHGGATRIGYATVADAISDLPELQPGEDAQEYSSPPRSELQRFLRGDQDVLLNHSAPKHPAPTIDRIDSTKPGEPMYPAFKQRIRLHPDRPSPTQLSGGIRPQFQFGHPSQPRGLTVRERARIQTFPDSYQFCGGVVQGRVQTGNAVPVMLARALAQSLLQCVDPEDASASARESASRAQQGLLFL